MILIQSDGIFPLDCEVENLPPSELNGMHSRGRWANGVYYL